MSDRGDVRDSASGDPVNQTQASSGYREVRFTAGGVSVRNYVHRLVAAAFIPNPDDLPEIDHINGDKADNRASNLRWCTHRQNCMYRSPRRNVNRPVVMLDSGWNVVARYASIPEAARETGIDRRNI